MGCRNWRMFICNAMLRLMKKVRVLPSFPLSHLPSLEMRNSKSWKVSMIRDRINALFLGRTLYGGTFQFSFSAPARYMQTKSTKLEDLFNNFSWSSRVISCVLHLRFSKSFFLSAKTIVCVGTRLILRCSRIMTDNFIT